MWFVFATLIHGIVIYMVDRVIHPLNNWGQDIKTEFKGSLNHQGSYYLGDLGSKEKVAVESSQFEHSTLEP